MDNTDYIESYFTNGLVPDQAREFEKRIVSDPGFAEEVAFYLSVSEYFEGSCPGRKETDILKSFIRIVLQVTRPQ